MRPFKLLTGEQYIEEDDILDSAMWMFVRWNEIDEEGYQLVTELYRGVNHFLSEFPIGFIVPVKEILSVDTNFTHDDTTENEPWGFDIRNGWMWVSWYRYIPD